MSNPTEKPNSVWRLEIDEIDDGKFVLWGTYDTVAGLTNAIHALVDFKPNVQFRVLTPRTEYNVEERLLDAFDEISMEPIVGKVNFAWRHKTVEDAVDNLLRLQATNPNNFYCITVDVGVWS